LAKHKFNSNAYGIHLNHFLNYSKNIHKRYRKKERREKKRKEKKRKEDKPSH